MWAATDEVLDRPVAVKILKPSLASDVVAVARFRREARLAARVNHPNVVAVYDTVSGEGCDAMVQELVAGRTLRDLLDDEPKLAIGRAVRIGISMADALAAVHEVGIVHRDVKPANVLLASDGRVLLTDFGIATRGRQDLTSEDVMMGTAKYLSPEQVEGEPASARADLYSLGVVLYECLAGRPPFLAESDAATALARLRADPIPLRTLRPAIPSRLATLVRACLARHPDDRPRSASALRDALVRLAPEITEDEVRPRLAVRLDPVRRRHRERMPVDGAGPSPGDADRDSDADTDRDADTHGGAAPLHRAPRRWPWLLAGAVVALVVAALGLSVLAPNPAGDTGQAPPDASTLAPNQPPATFTVTTTSTTPPSTRSPASGATTVATTAPQDVRIVSIGEFDPPPGDGKENPGLLGNVFDDDPRTVWSSLCYDEVGLGAKEGIGLVFELSGPAAGHVLQVSSTTRRWSASVFVAESRPPTLRAWGPAVSARRDITSPTIDLPLEDAEGRYVLLWVTRLGDSPVCKLPFDIRISEVKLLPA